MAEFWYAESDSTGLIESGTMTAIGPHPTTVEYPKTFNNKSRKSRDGNTVIQSSMTDDRKRRWIWRGYTLTTPGYSRLFSALLNLQYSLRRNRGDSDWVFLKEIVTGNLNKLVLSGDTWTEQEDYVRVKVLNVSEQIVDTSSMPKYDVVFEFIIDDDTWNRY